MKAVKLMVLLLALQGPPAFGQAAAPTINFDTKDLFQNAPGKKRLITIATALIGTDTSMAAKDVKHFCSDRMKDFDATVESFKQQKDCLAYLITLYKTKESGFTDIPNFKENLRRLELLVQGADKGLFKKAGLTLTATTKDNTIELPSSIEGGYRLHLRSLFELPDQENIEDYTGKFSYSVEGCETSINEMIAGKNDNDTIKVGELKPLARQIERLTIFKGLIDCRLNPTKGLLILNSSGRAKGSVRLPITAVYTDNSGENILASATKHVQVDVVPRSNPNYCTNWNCGYNAGFFIGAEGASVEEVKTEAILRYEFASYSQVQHNHVHLFGRIFQTTKSEFRPKNSSQMTNCDTAPTECEAEVNSAISGEIGMNLFVAKSTSGDEEGIDWGGFKKPLKNKDLAFGASIQYNIIKSDQGDKEFTDSYYTGLRFAYSKYQYFDILYGKDEGVKGNRVKLKGQLPTLNDNFIVGVEINVAADSKQKKANRDGVDNIKLYATYEVDFSDFLR